MKNHDNLFKVPLTNEHDFIKKASKKVLIKNRLENNTELICACPIGAVLFFLAKHFTNMNDRMCGYLGLLLCMAAVMILVFLIFGLVVDYKSIENINYSIAVVRFSCMRNGKIALTFKDGTRLEVNSVSRRNMLRLAKYERKALIVNYDTSIHRPPFFEVFEDYGDLDL